METIDRVIEALDEDRTPPVELGEEPDREAIREAVSAYEREGLCGRRIGQQHLGPYFVANPEYGRREIDLLEEVLAEEYEGTGLCIRRRSSECSRLLGGCKNS